MQEAILLVGAATSPLELRLAVTSALHTALPDLVHTSVHTMTISHTQSVVIYSNSVKPGHTLKRPHLCN